MGKILTAVSHLKERKEKNCLNCQSQVAGRYCQVCGQENLEPVETVWHLVSHFFNDITHFDGKFFATVKYLLRRPGFLSLEYMKGRRMAYLNPIRMYVFTSAIFFIIMFALKSPDDVVHINEAKDKPKGIAELRADQARRANTLKNADDEDDRESLRTKIRNDGMEIESIKKNYGDTTRRIFTQEELTAMLLQAYGDSLTAEEGLGKGDSVRIKAAIRKVTHPSTAVDLGGWHSDYNSADEYDSAQRSLPDSLRDGWFKTIVMRRMIHITQEWREDKHRFYDRLFENIYHSFPKILFVSLPIFALILNILYFRHKQYYYVNHGIFAIHVYCATFVLMLVSMLLDRLDKAIGVHWIHVIADILEFVLFLYIVIYLYKAMRGFYKQGRGKTFLKYFITFVSASIVNLILLVIFLLISIVSV